MIRKRPFVDKQPMVMVLVMLVFPQPFLPLRLVDLLKAEGYPRLRDNQLETEWRMEGLKQDANIPGLCRKVKRKIKSLQSRLQTSF